MRRIIDILIGLRLRQWAIAALTVLALVLVYTGVWVYGATQTVKAAERWIDARRGEGYSVRHDGLRATGYPVWIRIDLASPGFGAPMVKSPWGWEAENLVITARPWALWRVRLHTNGAQMISFLADGQRLTFTGSVDTADAELIFDGGNPQSVALHIAGLDLGQSRKSGGNIAVATADLALRRLANAGGAQSGVATIGLDVTSSDVELPSSLASPLGGRIENLRLAARLLGEFPRGEGAPLNETLEIWRDGGGTVEVDHLALGHGPLTLRANGTLALDRDLQPIGAFTAQAQGFFETIDAFSGAGMIGAGQAMSAKLLLGVLAQHPKNGGPAILNLALTVQQRTFYAGPVKLLQLPMLQWR